MDLKDFGLKKGYLHEAIITTFHLDGIPNAAPIGVYVEGSEKIVLNVHKKTDTYQNIKRARCCNVNIVHDPYMFLRCALLGSNMGSGEVELEGGGVCPEIKAPYILDADSYIALELIRREEFVRKDSVGESEGERMIFKPVGGKLLKAPYSAPDRGLYAGIELAIGLSRGKKDEVERFLRIIEKSRPKKEYEKIKAFLTDFLDSLNNDSIK